MLYKIKEADNILTYNVSEIRIVNYELRVTNYGRGKIILSISKLFANFAG